MMIQRGGGAVLKKLTAAICLLALCAGFLVYNLEIGLSRPETPSTTTTAPLPGQVRFINRDPELQQAWEEIAADYTEKTGTVVQIIPEDEAAGITPTLFTVADETELASYKDVCLDLAGTRATHHLNWSLTLYAGKKMCGLPAQAEGYGLIYNATLLRQAGQTPSDITSFAKLQEVARHISSTGNLHFSPFASIDTNSSALSLLACMPGNIRPFWDLYISNAAGGGLRTDATQEILDGSAVFCIGSTTEYGLFSTMSEENLNILPLYIGMENEAQQGLCVRVENYWCVRNDVSSQDIEATLDFVDYLLHPVDGVPPVDRLEIFTPYTTATYYASPLEKTLREHISAGKNVVVFSQLSAPEGLAEALKTYAADPTDENWSAVESILE